MSSWTSMNQRLGLAADDLADQPVLNASRLALAGGWEFGFEASDADFELIFALSRSAGLEVGHRLE